MKIDAALVIGVGVFEIIGKASDGREFIAGLRIEIRIAKPTIERTMPDADIRWAGPVERESRLQGRRSKAPEYAGKPEAYPLSSAAADCGANASTVATALAAK